MEDGACATQFEDREASSWARAYLDLPLITSRLHDVRDITENVIVDVYLFQFSLHLKNGVRLQNRLLVKILSGPLHASQKYLYLLLTVRIANSELHYELV